MSSDPWGNASTAQVNKESSVNWTEQVNNPTVEQTKDFDFLGDKAEELQDFLSHRVEEAQSGKLSSKSISQVMDEEMSKGGE